MNTQELFNLAVADSKSLAARPDNATLLKLYSLFKQATEGNASDDAPSNPFDFVGKAKHDAWAELSGMSKEAAMNQYISLVNELKGN